MSSKFQWRKAVFSAVVLSSFVFNIIPIHTQDIVGSDDISGGASVFVFRQSGLSQQSKFASRTIARRNNAQKSDSRRSLRDQVAKVIPKRPRAPKIDPNSTLALNNSKTPAKTPVKNPGKTPAKTPGKTAEPDDTSLKAKSSETLAGLGETFLDLKNYDKSIEAFRKALADNPNNVNAKLGLSDALVAKGDDTIDKSSGSAKEKAETAVGYYEEAAKLNTQNAVAYAALGGAYEDLENADLAAQDYDKALKINPNLTELYAPLGAIYYQKGDIANADTYLTKAAAANADNDQTQYMLGLIRSKQNRNEDAIAAFNKSVAVKDSAEAHFYLAEIYDRTNRNKEAIDEYNKAIAVNSSFAPAYFDLGTAYYNRADYQNAINAYSKGLILDNTNGEAHENLADAYRQMKEYPKAEGEYNLAVTFIERDANKPDSKMNLNPKGVAELYSKFGFVQGRQSKWDAAIINLNKALKLSPDSIDYTNLGWAYYNSAQTDKFNKQTATANAKLNESKKALETAASMTNNNAGTYMNLGLTLNDLGEYQKASTALETATKLKEKWVPAYNELGFAYRNLNQLDKAVANFKLASELDKKYYPAFFNLSEAEFRRGNLKEARKAQEALKKLGQGGLATKLEVIFTGAGFVNPAQNLQNKVKSKIPGLPF